MTDEIPAAQNRLEGVLERAAHGDVDAREHFPNVLLNGELYIVGHIEGPAESTNGNYATLDASQLRIPTAQLGDETVVVAFTSLARIEEATGGKLPYVGLRGRELLERRQRGLKLVINPGVWHGTELTSDEIDRLLDGGIATVPAGTTVMIGLAAHLPEALVDQLREWLGTRPDVISARLGQVFDETSGEPSHPIVGLELAEGAQMASVFASAPTFEEPVDLVPLADHPLGEWLRGNGKEIHRA